MLSPQEQAAYADRLRERESTIQSQLRSNDGASAPVQLDQEIGRLTRMDALQQQQMALHARRRLEIQLSQVRGALVRVNKGEFGLCALCKQDIPPQRLELTPEAPFCIACQEKIEQGRA
jgi:DnaK suppressor protein